MKNIRLLQGLNIDFWKNRLEQGKSVPPWIKFILTKQ